MQVELDVEEEFISVTTKGEQITGAWLTPSQSQAISEAFNDPNFWDTFLNSVVQSIEN